MNDKPESKFPEHTLPEHELQTSLIEYPCDFPIKIFGQQQAGFAQAVLEVVNKHDPDFVAASMEMRASKNARYISLTCTVHATSREQLDALYQDLCDHPLIVMVL
jgi:putative lipoic acid-binding regulatory protein